MGDIFYRCEGYADAVLLETFGIPSNRIIITQGSSGIVKAMKQMPRSIVIGLTDNDKRKPPFFGDFEEVFSMPQLCHKRKPGTCHHLVFLLPAFEQWILDAARSVGVEPNAPLTMCRILWRS